MVYLLVTPDKRILDESSEGGDLLGGLFGGIRHAHRDRHATWGHQRWLPLSRSWAGGDTTALMPVGGDQPSSCFHFLAGMS